MLHGSRNVAGGERVRRPVAGQRFDLARRGAGRRSSGREGVLGPGTDTAECVLDARTPARQEHPCDPAPDSRRQACGGRRCNLPAVHSTRGTPPRDPGQGAQRDRCSGKSTFLKQIGAERRRTVAPEQVVYLNFDDDRLGTLDVDQLSLMVEEHYRRHPELRGRQVVSWLLDEWGISRFSRFRNGCWRRRPVEGVRARSAPDWCVCQFLSFPDSGNGLRRAVSPLDHWGWLSASPPD